MDKLEKLNMYRHSTAHVLAKALIELYPTTKLTIGPSIESGFYYDIDLKDKITELDFEKIEQKMNEIICNNEDFKREVATKKKALEVFKDNEYKTELINELPENEEISLYYLGDNFVDLCRGPHVENTKFLRTFSFKLNKVAGAYWRGNENNVMLQRIYAFGFMDKNELKAHLRMLEEAKLRDHRKLGRELDLFFLSEYAQGMPFYTPKGMTVKNELIKYWREMHTKAGYVEIETPIALNRSLWEVSGHWDHYRDNMYTFGVEGDTFAVKPMNCPGGMLYYKEKIHSYKDFPLRVGELGKVHRHEASGTLHGLLRVRSFVQDDAHIFMLPSQIEQEIFNVIKLTEQMYGTFGLTFHLELSTMPESHIGDEKDWAVAEQNLKNALEKLGRDYVINEGDGAFYGPKIDIHIKDAIGRTWQCGTIQLDMQLPGRFDLEYVDADGSKKRPIMIHRVVYGSLERFMAVIIEHFAGAFPLWLAPVQVKILNISDNSLDYCNQIYGKLFDLGIRVELDGRNESISKKIKEAQMQKVPYMIICGDKEKQDNTIAIRQRGKGDIGSQNLDDFIDMLLNSIKDRTLN